MSSRVTTIFLAPSFGRFLSQRWRRRSAFCACTLIARVRSPPCVGKRTCPATVKRPLKAPRDSLRSGGPHRPAFSRATITSKTGACSPIINGCLRCPANECCLGDRRTPRSGRHRPCRFGRSGASPVGDCHSPGPGCRSALHLGGKAADGEAMIGQLVQVERSADIGQSVWHQVLSLLCYAPVLSRSTTAPPAERGSGNGPRASGDKPSVSPAAFPAPDGRWEWHAVTNRYQIG